MTRTAISAARILILATIFLSRTFPEDALALDHNKESGALIGKRAPEIARGRWVNGRSHTLSEVRGRVVLLEFWTYGCSNCRNTIPKLNEWHEKYAESDFILIGVHTPEFDREKDFMNVRRQTARLGIRYAVVTDNEYETWNAYRQQYWPTIYLIDRKGIIRHIQTGEGGSEQTERAIQALIGEK
jgi:thiol-disulfide isomerase/thioredoxin